ncbi:uncharacterized protein LOC141599238 [Silene latifolia]|uniref:uncharacterized protein LOC141599238 n=1 Tax=Silene latifolia TaxID=37657 RepID=UPI003D76C70A
MGRRRRTMFDYAETYWPAPTDAYWRHAEEIAQEIAVSYKHHLDSPPVERVRIMKLRVEPGKGVEYNMTIEVTGENGINTSYAVKVYRLPSGLPYQVASFDKIVGSERKTTSCVSDGGNVSDEKASSSSIITRSGKTSDDEKASSRKRGKRRASDSTMPDDNESSTASVSGVTGRVRTRGFYFLVEQIRRERPTLSYAKARKSASSTWAKLSEDEKMTFMGKAAKRLKKK